MAFTGVSCQVAFDLDIDETPLIFLESFPGLDDVVEFDIQPAYSLANSAPRPDFNPEILFTVNGKEIPVVQNIGHCVSEEHLEERYIADYKPVPGDKLRIEVSSDGFESIFAETVIPELFPERKIDYQKTKIGDMECSVLSVTPDSEQDKPYAYGMNILRETTFYFSEDSTYVSSSPHTGYQIGHYYEMAPMSFDGLIIRDGHKQNPLGVWQINPQKECVMSFIFESYVYMGHDSYEEFFAHEGEYVEYDDMGNMMTYKYRERNKLFLYTLSEEFYKYELAQVLVNNNTDFPGIAPANFCYTNINGGCGAFAGLARVETDWITKEFIENNR